MTEEPPEREPYEPSLSELMLSNAKFMGVVLVLAAMAWGVWWLLAKLFPEFGWLQPRQ